MILEVVRYLAKLGKHGVSKKAGRVILYVKVTKDAQDLLKLKPGDYVEVTLRKIAGRRRT